MLTLFSASVSKLFQRQDHKTIFTKLLILENAAVFLGGCALLMADLDDQPLHNPLYWLSVAFMCVDAVCSSVLSVVTEKDWVAAVCDGDEAALARANGLMVRVDLFVSIGSYFCVGQVMEQTDASMLLLCLIVWHVLSASSIWIIVTSQLELVFSKSAHLTKSVTKDVAVGIQVASQWISSFKRGYKMFLALPGYTQRLMVGFIFVWMTVLSPGEIMTAWLVSIGTSTDHIANFRASAQAIGCVSTIVAPMMVARLGAPLAAALGVLEQCLCLILLCVPGVLNSNASILMIGVIASRLGLWMFDLGERQVVQISVDPEHRAFLFNWEKSMCNAAQLVAMLLASLFSQTDQFWILALWSTAAILCASVLSISAMLRKDSKSQSTMVAVGLVLAVVLSSLYFIQSQFNTFTGEDY